MPITAFKITGINQFNQPDAIAFIQSKVLKFADDTRGAIKRTLTFPNYAYFTKIGVTQEEIDAASFQIQVFELPDGYYKNVSDQKLEIPYEVVSTGVIGYLRVFPGAIVVPTSDSIRILLNPFITRSLLIKQDSDDGIADGVWFTDNVDWQTGSEDWFTN